MEPSFDEREKDSAWRGMILLRKLIRASDLLDSWNAEKLCPRLKPYIELLRFLGLDANTLFNDEDINADVMAELNTIIQQLSDKDQKFLLSFARLLLQYSQGD